PGVTNTARVATAGDNDAANDVANDPTAVSPPATPDLAIGKSHAGNFTSGFNGTYTLTVNNLGGAATSGAITVTDTLPAGLTFVSGAGAGWSFGVSGAILTATSLGPLAPGAGTGFTITVSVGPAAVPSVTNRAVVATAGDGNAANDVATDPTTVNGSPT